MEYDIEKILTMYEDDYTPAIGPRAMVGEITDQQTQFGRPIYQTPGGERVSEKSTTLFLNGNWMNVPSIHGGKSFNEDELRLMIKRGNIEPTSVHKSKNEAEAAAKARSDSMVPGPRNMAYGGRIPFAYAGPVKFENIIKPKIYEGNRFSKKMPKGTFSIRLYMGLDENGEKIFKTFVGTKKQLKKIFDQYNKGRVKGELPTMVDGEVYQVRQGENKGKWAIRMPKDDSYSFFDTQELAEQYKTNYLNDPANQVGGDRTVGLENKKYPKGYLTKKQFLQFLKDNGITGKNAASFANNFGIKTKPNPYNKNLVIYDTSEFTEEKINDIQRAQVKAGSGSKEAKKKFPIKTKSDIAQTRYKAIEEKFGVKKGSPLEGKRKLKVDMGHAGNIYSPFSDELITLDKLTYTPSQINEIIGQKGGIDDKIRAIQNSQFKVINKMNDADAAKYMDNNKIPYNKASSNFKQQLLSKSDATLTRLVLDSGGEKVARLSDGTTFGGSFLKNPVDFFDEFSGMTEKDFVDFRRKYITDEGNLSRSILSKDANKKRLKINLVNTDNIPREVLKDDLSPKELKELTDNLTKLKFFEMNRASSMKSAKVSKKELSKVLQDFEKHGCGLAAGGRILFAEGTPGGKPTKCAQKGVARFIDDLKKGNYSKATVNLLKGGGNLVKNILDPKELLKLRNYFGPVALGFMAAYEGGVIGDDVIRQGTPLNESLANNWLTKSFLPYTKDYAQAKNLLESGTVPANMKKYVQDVVTFNEALKDMQGIENRVSSRLVDQGGYGMIDGTSMYSQEQQDKEDADVIKKLSGITDYNFLSGSAKDLEYKKMLDEMEATRMAKPKSINIFGKDFQYSDGFSPLFGFGSLKDRNQTVAFDDYISPVDTPKDLRPITYMDAEYEDVKTLPAAERKRYEDYFTEKGFLKPRQSLSELKFGDSNVYEEILKDYNKFQRQKFASQYPGYYGTQEPDRFMEGGIASLNVKK